MVMIPRPVLLYDGDCRLCRFAARIVDSADRRGRIALLPLADEAADPLVRTDGRIASRCAAGIELLEALGHERPARAAGRAEPLAERAYTLVARHRDRLGALVPNGPAPRRFP